MPVAIHYLCNLNVQPFFSTYTKTWHMLYKSGWIRMNKVGSYGSHFALDAFNGSTEDR
ncbi:hypothetical protein Niako_6368 [Niastella koreensis GR20-10]|uniref:Uncharacterized protein n=1 Tax=Niastella koreensis (strain DSM 17620 / KACC 11465 / NBRC 106392 / GR20-10) TaxID=700598 RepID=G8TDV8_NIAKG|nr:hypothetical protein Niako_6368 [Niastella koreensis GR20-10]